MGPPATRAVPRPNPRISGHITGVTRVSVEGRPGERSFALLSTTLSHDVALTCENVTKHVVSAVGEALNRCCAPVNAHEALQHEKTPRKRGSHSQMPAHVGTVAFAANILMASAGCRPG